MHDFDLHGSWLHEAGDQGRQRAARCRQGHTMPVRPPTITTAKSKLVAKRRATILLRGTRAHRPYIKHHSPHMKHKLTPLVSTPYQRCLAVALLSGFPEAILGLNNGQNTNFMPKLVGRCQNVRPCCTISAVKTHFCGRNRASKRGYGSHQANR